MSSAFSANFYIIFTLSMLNFTVQARSIETRVCDSLIIEGRERISFSNSEIRLLCGDPKVKDWRVIPHSQTLFHLRTFLQSRGFYAITPSNLQDSVLRVSLGEPTLISSITLIDIPAGLRIWAADAFTGDRLTPDALSEIEQRVKHRLGQVGFACLELDTKGDAVTGKVTIRLTSGKPQNLVSIEEQPIPQLAPGTLRRFDAFVVGEIYNVDNMRLTGYRIVANGIVRNFFFESVCTDAGVVAKQNILEGHPREVSVGVGLNTDRGLMARASWTQTRLDSRGSSLTAAASASFKDERFHSEQISIDSHWYFLNDPSRFHLRSLVKLKRLSDNRIDYLTGEVGISPATTWDTVSHGGFASLGPLVKREHKFRGEGRSRTYYLGLKGELNFLTHDFELRRSDPHSGFEWLNSMLVSRHGMLADYSANILQSRFTYLLPFGSLRRSELVFGVRTELSATILPDDEGGLDSVPPSLRHYLGGSSNLRGFNFQEVPGDQGALTSYFLGTELRAIGWLPFGLEILAFNDVGTASQRSLDFSDSWFTSPGAGLRWPSPAGVLRLSMAHGFVLGSNFQGDTRSHWQFHLTLGEEF